MRLIIVTNHIGPSPTGFVNESLIASLCKLNEQTFIICKNYQSKILREEQIAIIPYEKKGWTAFRKILLIVFNKDILSLPFLRIGSKSIKLLLPKKKPDAVIALTSAYGIDVISLSYNISNKLGIPLIIHSTDPLPATPGWGENKFLRKSIISTIRKYYKRANLISASNKHMLDYQLDILGIDRSIPSVVTYNPPKLYHCDFSNLSKNKIFLYLGSFYNKRNPQLLINAFEKFNKIYHDSQLYIVGQKYENSFLLPVSISEKVHFIAWVNNPEEYIIKADVLIDIDADIQNDVFISSKLTNYLMIDKPILCITPSNSPSSFLVEDLSKTVFVSTHDEEKILESMKLATTSILSSAYQERSEIRALLTPETIGLNFNKIIHSVITQSDQVSSNK